MVSDDDRTHTIDTSTLSAGTIDRLAYININFTMRHSITLLLPFQFLYVESSSKSKKRMLTKYPKNTRAKKKNHHHHPSQEQTSENHHQRTANNHPTTTTTFEHNSINKAIKPRIHNVNDQTLDATACTDEPDWTEIDTHRTCAHYNDNPNDCGAISISISTSTTNNNSTANNPIVAADEACCACGGGCIDTPSDWTDFLNDPCSWYEDNDSPGCPFYGDTTGMHSQLTANDVCCHCRLTASIIDDDVSTVTDDDTPYITNDDVSTIQDDDITPTAPDPNCSNVPHDWTDEFGDGCEYLEEVDVFGCELYGFIVGTGGVRALEACCWCGGGEVEPLANLTTLVPSAVPSVAVPLVSVGVDSYSDAPSSFPSSIIVMQEEKPSLGPTSTSVEAVIVPTVSTALSSAPAVVSGSPGVLHVCWLVAVVVALLMVIDVLC